LFIFDDADDIYPAGRKKLNIFKGNSIFLACKKALTKI